MNIKKFFWNWKQNIAIIVAAAFLATGIFYVVNNPEIFTASILSLQEKAFIVEKWRDIAYKTNSGYVDIFMAEKMDTPASIDFTISFDKDTIIIDPQNLSGQWTRTFSNPDENSILITSIPGTTVDKSQSLIMLSFTGDMTHILLSEAVVKLSNSQEKNLSIWSLNEITSHSN